MPTRSSSVASHARRGDPRSRSEPALPCSSRAWSRLESWIYTLPALDFSLSFFRLSLIKARSPSNTTSNSFGTAGSTYVHSCRTLRSSIVIRDAKNQRTGNFLASVDPSLPKTIPPLNLFCLSATSEPDQQHDQTEGLQLQ